MSLKDPIIILISYGRITIILILNIYLYLYNYTYLFFIQFIFLVTHTMTRCHIWKKNLDIHTCAQILNETNKSFVPQQWIRQQATQKKEEISILVI